MTLKRYLAEPQLLTLSTTIKSIGQDDKGAYVMVHETIAHAQGGGQQADKGTINNKAIKHVIHSADKKDVLHYIDSINEFAVGQAVDIVIDPDHRRLAARYHNGGHLLAHIVEELYPQLKGVQGHHWPGESRVDFNVDGTFDIPADFGERVGMRLQEQIVAALPVKILGDPFVNRAIQIGDYEPLPCGGTHPQTTKELKAIQIRGTKMKGAQLRVGYEIAGG